MPQDVVARLPLGWTRAAVRPETVVPDARTVELTWTTGARVKRVGFWDDEPWLEELGLEDEAVDLTRLNRGANLLAAHRSQDLDGILGVVEWARLERDVAGNREVRALVRFSERPRADEVFRDVRDGIIRNVSVGYITHALDQVEKADRAARTPAVYRATRWEPVELSLCAVPADAGAQVRAADEAGARYACNVRRIAMDTPSTVADRPKDKRHKVRAEDERPPGAPEPGEDKDEH